MATPQDILGEIRDRRLETIRLCFVDQHGILRGKTLVADALQSAFDSGVGVPSTLLLKDTSHRTVFPIWETEVNLAGLPLSGAGDLLMQPDPARFFPLPWSPHSAILLCNLTDHTGVPVTISPTSVLRHAVDQLTTAGYRATFGLEVEFQVFDRVDDALDHSAATMPPAPPLTRNTMPGHQFLTETRYAEIEALLDVLRRNAEALGLEPRTVEIEMGPSQVEFTFAPGDPETQAARFVMFRTMVKEMCHRRGLHASFMPKPNLPNAAANGWHMHQSLANMQTGQNVFMPGPDGALTTAATGWIAGLLEMAADTCLLTNSTVNSYKRFAPFQLAPNRVQWGKDNRGAMIRALLHPDNPASRIENRVADSAANPYFAFAGQIHAGLHGINAGMVAPAPCETPYAETADGLPENLRDAIDAFAGSELAKAMFGADFVDYLSVLKRAEWNRYRLAVSDWEQSEYFALL